MKQTNFERYIHTLDCSKRDAEHAVISAYVRIKKIDFDASDRIRLFVAKTDALLVDKLADYLSAEYQELNLYTLSGLFEDLVDDADKKENGIVYTPVEIQKIIIDNLFSVNGTVPKICDPSCGCGSFLLTAARWIHDKLGCSYRDILADHIFGIEIEEGAVRQAEILFDLFLIENGEVPPEKYHVFCADSTNRAEIDSIKAQYGGFDYVIGNPPYVRSRNMKQEERENLHFWRSSSVGNVDLYIPFYEIGIYLLNEGGRLGYISPNTFMQSVNGRGLRNLLIKSASQIRIADFREAQMFEGVTSYTSIVWIDRDIRNSTIFYSRVKNSDDMKEWKFTEYSKARFNPDKRWRMYDRDVNEIVRKLENAGKSLDTWKIRNGLATLKNDLYFFEPSSEDRDFYFREYRGKNYRIEKDICINVVKPNVIRDENELAEKMEKAIFPYVSDKGSFICYSEEEMKQRFPYAYCFLKEYRDELDKRDKGKGKYPAWYAYGRTQGMNNSGKKILIPYISGAPVAVICTDPEILFYCGYALISDDEEELRILKKFLKSDAFWYYICVTSKPYAKGYMAFAKNYIAKFTIPTLSDAEKAWLLDEHEKAEENLWIWKKYGIQNIPE